MTVGGAGEEPVPMHSRRPVLDEAARHDIAGVVVAVVAIAMLIAVLTPTSGVLTQAVSKGLHAVLGLGAFLLPVVLLLWAVSFFVRIPKLVPGRVAIGLGVIVLSVMGLIGLCTPGAEADSARLFNEYVLADRGGYVGNGLAWLLLALVGKPVGVIALSGAIAAGLIVIGLNVNQAVQCGMERYRQTRAYGRARSEERASRAQHGVRYRTMRPGDYARDCLPQNYAPTALFDPSRPLSQPLDQSGFSMARECDSASFPAGHPVFAPTSYLGHDACVAPQTTMLDSPHPVPSVPAAPNVPADVAGAPQGGIPVFAEMPVASAAERPSDDMRATCDVQAQPIAFSSQVQPIPGGNGDEPGFGAGTPRPRSCGVRQTSRRRPSSAWWDPADDWTRDDFDPNDSREFPRSAACVPGVLPGAPVTLDDYERASVVEHCIPIETNGIANAGENAVPPAVSSVGDEEIARPCDGAPAHHEGLVPSRRADSDEPVRDRVSARTKAALAASRTAPARISSQSNVEPDAGRGEGVELPWEPAHVAVPADGEAVHTAVRDIAFKLPDPSVMHRGEQGLSRSPEQHQHAREMANRLQTTLNEFGVKAEVVDWVEGPTCTTYQVNPGEGVRVNRFTSLEDDIARALACSGVRIYAPVPGTSYIGIEVPNTTRQIVYFGDVLPYLDGGPLDFVVGLDANGKPVHADLAKLPHLLVAGTTGSGKSVVMNSIVMSMLMRDTPDDVRLIMIDPKRVEFNDYNGIPHLIMPVVTDMRQAAAALQWGVAEMDRRYRVFSDIGVRDLKSYNKLVDGEEASNENALLQHLPSIVIVIDELADLMMVAKKDVEASIVRIAQLGRACGIHLVMATQSPRADVVTGLIRANVANRIGLKVAKGTDSIIVIDQTGAEKLLGNGDMLFLQTSWGDRPRRIQGCWISDAEISQVVSFLKEQTCPEYNYQMAPLPGATRADGACGFSESPATGGSQVNDDEPLAWKAATLVVENQLGSTSMLQRHLKVGYARAGRVMDMLEEMGIVGPARGSKPRDVLVRDLDELASIRGELGGTEGDY